MRGGAVVARQAHNLKAVGSIPAPATKKITPGSVNGSGFFIFNKSLMPFTLPPPYVSDASISVDCVRFAHASGFASSSPRYQIKTTRGSNILDAPEEEK